MSIKQVWWTQKNSHKYCEISSTCWWSLHLKKRTSKMKSKIFTSVTKSNHLHRYPLTWPTTCFFTGEGRGGHLGPTYFRDLTAIPFGEHMVLLETCIWNAYLFHFLAWLLLLLKSILPVLTRSLIKK